MKYSEHISVFLSYLSGMQRTCAILHCHVSCTDVPYFPTLSDETERNLEIFYPIWEHAVAQWPRHCATNRKVARSICRMAVTWIVAHFVYYRLWKQHGQSLNDYRTYLKGARRHVCQCPKRKQAVGNYLDVFWMERFCLPLSCLSESHERLGSFCNKWYCSVECAGGLMSE
jgi:hypothetical protein